MVVVQVLWNDVYKESNTDDFDKNKQVSDYLAKILTIGWELKTDKNSIMLVQEFNSDGTPRDFVVIPKSLIIETKRYVLK